MKKFLLLLLLSFNVQAECKWLDDDFCMDELPSFSEYCKTGSMICKPMKENGHKATYEELQAVNEAVNEEIYWQAETDNVWRRPLDGYGDCEDFAIEKAERLLALGWTTNNLRLAGVNKNHMVLLATIGNETYVLDNQFQYATKLKDDVRYIDVLQIRGTKYWEIRE